MKRWLMVARIGGLRTLLPESIFVSHIEGPGGGGVLPYKSDGNTRRKISRTLLKGTRILYYGRVPNSFPPPQVPIQQQQII